ncbi:hypothetical protein KKG24_02715 [Patescibacteria group bacterium]|nr:hypothetical protein [Patescibacteria group bacterium]
MDFWEKLKRWHLDDIDKCLVVNANYAATKTMLSLVDALGALYGGLIEHKGKYYVLVGDGSRSKATIKLYRKQYEESGTKKQFLNFTKNYLNEFFQYKTKVKSREILLADILYDHFRCGLIHEGHPKFGTGICRENNFNFFILNSGGVKIALNILALRDMLRRAVFTYEKDLFDKTQPERMKRWKERFKYLSKLRI